MTFAATADRREVTSIADIFGHDQHPPPEDDEEEEAPHDDQLERALIGALLLSPAKEAAECLAVAGPEAMYRDAHQDILKAIAAIAGAGEDPDLPLVTAELKHKRRLTTCGGVPYLSHCLECPSAWQAGPKYAQRVAAHYLRRCLAEAAGEIARLAKDNGKPPAELMAQASALIADLPIEEPKAPLVNGDDLARLIGEPEWLWQDWLLRGFITFLGAEPGMGKSAVALWIAANISCGGRWPDGAQITTGTRTLWLDAEGMQAENLKRLRCWGFDRAGIAWLGEDGMAPVELHKPGAFRSYVQAAVAAGCGLVVIDSLRFAFAGDEDSSTMVGVLQQVKEVVQEFHVACIIIHHLRKQRETETTAVTLDRFRGSSVIGAVARCMWGMWRPDKQDPSARLEVIKSNIGPCGAALGVQWAESGLTFGDAPEEPQTGRPISVRSLAQEVIEALLAHGPRTYADLKAEATAQGITDATFERARRDMGLVKVEVRQDGRPFVAWALPTNRER